MSFKESLGPFEHYPLGMKANISRVAPSPPIETVTISRPGNCACSLASSLYWSLSPGYHFSVIFGRQHSYASCITRGVTGGRRQANIVGDLAGDTITNKTWLGNGQTKTESLPVRHAVEYEKG